MSDESTQGMPKGAELARLELAFSQDPNSKVFVELAQAYMDAGRLVEAMVVAKKGMRAHPAEGRLTLAKVYFRQQKFPKAAEEVAAVLAAEPQNAQALCLKGDMHFRSGENDAGIEAYKKALEALPGDAAIKAVLKEHGVDTEPKAPPPPPKEHLYAPPKPRKKYVVTVKAEEAGTDKPDWMRKQAARRSAILVSVLVLLSIAVIGSVGIFAHKARKVDRLMKEARVAERADTYANYVKAQSLALEASNTDKGNESAAAETAWLDALLYGAYTGDEKYAKNAVEMQERASKAKEPPQAIFAAQALLRYYSGDQAGAEKAAVEGVSRYPNGSKVLMALGMVQAATGNYEGAVESYKRARAAETSADVKNTDPRSLAAIADLSVRQGAYRQALAQYDFILKSQPGHIGAMLGRAQILIDAGGNPADAEKEAMKVLEMPETQLSAKERSLAYFTLSMATMAQGREKEAEGDLAKALELDPRNSQFHYMLAKRYAAMRNWQAAKSAFDKAISLDGKKPEYYRDYAEMQIRSGDADGAIQNVSRAMMNLSDRDKGQYYLLKARALRLKKDFKEGRKEIAKAIALNSEDPYAHLELAVLICDQGSYDDAAAEFEIAEGGFLGVSNPRMEAEAYVRQAACSMSLKDGAGAEELLKKAVDRDKFNADAYYWYGKVLKADKKRSGEAQNYFDLYVRMAPGGEHVSELK